MAKITRKDVLKAVTEPTILVAVPLTALGSVVGHPEVVIPATGMIGTIAGAKLMSKWSKAEKKKKLKKVM